METKEIIKAIEELGQKNWDEMQKQTKQREIDIRLADWRRCTRATETMKGVLKNEEDRKKKGPDAEQVKNGK